VNAAAHAALERWGFGTSSVRFICGTFDIHKELEARLSEFLGCEDTILYSSAFDANGGFFEPFFGPDDAIIADALNHASVIDGVRLTKAKRYIYAHSDMVALRAKLEEAQGARYRVIATDGVFSMDGDIALLAEICDLAEEFDALVMVDDSHATGFVGPTGRGTPELCGVSDRVDVITTTFGKAMGGANGGSPVAPRSWSGCARRAARTCSPTQWRRWLQRPRLLFSACCPRRLSCVTALRQAHSRSASASRTSASASPRAATRSSRSCCKTRRSPTQWPRNSSAKVSM
jgi:glycine C-acetyltransferase